MTSNHIRNCALSLDACVPQHYLPILTVTDYLPILIGIQPAEFHQQGTTLSLAYRSVMDPKHLPIS